MSHLLCDPEPEEKVKWMTVISPELCTKGIYLLCTLFFFTLYSFII